MYKMIYGLLLNLFYIINLFIVLKLLKMKIQEVIDSLEEWAPSYYAENFDNTGLLVGQLDTEVTGILITLDTLEIIVDEAIEKKCNLIVSFHPIIFKGLKKLNGKNYVEKVVIKAIQHHIAIYAIHTALDNSIHGLNDMICDKLGLINRQILIPKKETIQKLVTYAPTAESEKIKIALFKAGAGSIGNYDHCSFTSKGFGSFRPLENANPSEGKIGKLHKNQETKIEITYPAHVQKQVLSALFETHSYEEVAYEISTLLNQNQQIGMGMIGELPGVKKEEKFLTEIKEIFKTGCIKHSSLLHKNIKKVAVLGGSGSFAIANAIAAGADIFITSDLKYHQFYEAEGKILIADIGHYESEQFTKNLIYRYLQKKFSNFAIILSDKNTNPIQYF